MKKRLLSFAMALCMVLSLLPAAAFADENAETPVCTCEEACTAENMNAECAVCGTEGAVVENCCKYAVPATEVQPEATTPPAPPVCTCEEACTAEEMSAECAVCGAEGAVVENCCKYVAPEPEESTEATTPPAPPVCTCEEACTADAMDAECPVCGAEGAVVENCGKYIAPVVEEQVEEVVQVGALAAEEPELTAVEKVQAMIDALPTVEELENADDEKVDEVYAAVQDVCDALDKLSEEELEQVNTEKLDALLEWFNGQVAALDDGTVTTEAELRAAVASATSGATITLGADITLTEELVVNYSVKRSFSLKLNMNGHTLTGSRIRVNGCTFTVDGELDADVKVTDHLQGAEYEKTYLKGGIFNNNVSVDGDRSYIVDGTFYGEVQGARAIIRGGTFYDKISCTRISGGTFYEEVACYATYGGTFHKKVNCTYAEGGTFLESCTVYMSIYDGIFLKSYTMNLGWIFGGLFYCEHDQSKKADATYAIEYMDDGATIAIEYRDLKKGSVFLGVTPSSKNGYTFTGQWSNADANKTYEFPRTIPSEDFSDSKKITLYAQWKEKDGYSVTFDTNGGNNIETKTDVKWADKVLDGIPDPVKDGWEFTGWKCGDTTVNADTTYGTLASSDTVGSIELTAQWKDITGPTGIISIGTDSWTKSPDNITFGLFFKDKQTVTITASDNSGEEVTIGYLLSDKALSVEELAAATFDTYDSEFTIAPDRVCVVYAKLTDTSGNVVYISSDGIVLDATAPVISGIEDGKTYCSAQTFTVTETYLDKVTVSGVEQTPNGSNHYSLNPAEEAQTIIVTDKAGNKAQMAVTVNDGHTYGEWQSNGNSTHTRYCIVEGCSVHEDGNCSGGKATCTSKAVCEYCGKEYGEIDSTNHNLEKVPAKAATVTETGNKEYWQCKDCGDLFSDPDGKDKIGLEDTVTAKLPPEIIKGKGQRVTEGEKTALSFTSNAAFSDFIRVELNGNTLAEKNYTAKEGSTVVTLNADCVSTLSAGEHTIGIVSESGTAATTFTVNAKAGSTDSPQTGANNTNSPQTGTNNKNIPQTGDNSPLALWIALLFASGVLLTVMGIYGKKKKYNR